ncbi:MAG TPA: SDR family NAD(P)-dependent oxidoreductase [Bryobacteraceae bacterium]|nr:SDR family NAD(P)-dependent oxidoreductase [Bryobacteraceae bacterium]
MNVLLTGAQGNLGKRVLQAFADRGDRTLLLPLGFDLTESSGLAELKRIARSAQPLDALVHLAGGFEGGTRMEDTPPSVFAAMMKANLSTSLGAFQTVLPIMTAQKSGSIVAISAEAARVPTATVSAYAASKAALYSLVQSVNAENNETGIRALALTPRVLDTDERRDQAAREIVAFVHGE